LTAQGIRAKMLCIMERKAKFSKYGKWILILAVTINTEEKTSKQTLDAKFQHYGMVRNG
jgi:hypothetical protein